MILYFKSTLKGKVNKKLKILSFIVWMIKFFLKFLTKIFDDILRHHI